MIRASLLVVCLVAACGGGRPETAPRLPIPEIDAKCSEYDNGSDGTIDYVYQFTYDPDGFLVQYTGTPTDLGIYTYDKDHFVLHYTENYDADPELEYEETYTRDAYGRILTYQQTNEGTTSGTQMTYDSSGRTLTIVHTGSEPGSVTYTYSGPAIWPVSMRAVYGTSATKGTFMTSNNDRTVHVDYDDGEDGTIDRTSDLTYNDDRQLLTSVSRLAGTVYERVTNTYDDRGVLTRRTDASTESGPDDSVYVSTFDSRGMRTMREVSSPSGAASGGVYREVDKATCSSPRTATAAPALRIKFRPSQHADMFGPLPL